MVTINEKELAEKTITTSYLYRGRIINVRQDQVLTGTGETAFREIVEHPGAVAIVALDEENRVILVRQHRQPAGTVLLEIPAGKLEAYEKPLDCARREFIEETTYDADEWHELSAFYPSPGFCDEKIYLFTASRLKKAVALEADPDENLEVIRVPLEEAAQMITNGQIIDGKTIIAIQQLLLKKY